MKIVTILGARPQFIKAGSVSRAIAERAEISEVIVHTGEHYDANMSDIFFEQMRIPKPDYFLGINGKSHGAMMGQMLEKIKDGWSKYVLRKSVEDLLPKEIVWRINKLGFAAPEESWIDSIEDTMKNCIERSRLLHTICDMQQMSSDYKSLDLKTKWKLFNIAKWEEVFDVKAD